MSLTNSDPSTAPAAGAISQEKKQLASPVLFLLGCERSGTTFVQETLKRWYDSADGNESMWVFEFYEQGLNLQSAEPDDQLRFIRMIFRNFYFANMVNYHGVYFEAEDFIQPGLFDYKLFVQDVFRHVARSKDKTWVLNKTCQFCKQMDLVDEIFDKPKVIHLLRDGRDVGLSLMRVEAWGPQTHYGAARWWRSNVEGIQKYAAKHMDGRYLQVRYEDLVREPVQVFEKMTRFYGIYDEERHAELERAIKIHPNNVQKWRKNFSPKELFVFESVAGEILNDNGYELEYPEAPASSIPAHRRLWYEFQETVVRRIKPKALLFRSFQLINSFIGLWPGLHKRFLRSTIFRKYFNYHTFFK